jgi:peptidyl-prolyl cis-trans isomerase A (cyclophilin A)
MRLSNFFAPSPFTAEFLEPRMLLSATLSSAIPAVSVAQSAAPTTVDLSSHFSDPTVTGTAVLLETPEGNIPLALTNSATPNTVANFVQYINSGEFADTIVHRSVPNFVIQGGGYTPDGNPINTFGTINSEAGQPNVAGTIAMALSTGPDSATSQWYINLVDNSSSLDSSGPPAYGPYTVFGNVVYNGMTVANAIANLPIIDASNENSAWNTLPVINYSGANPISSPVPDDNLVTVDAVVVPALSYTVSSSNASLVNPSISGSTLSLDYGGGAGSATITVTATDLGGGTATSTFAVGVGETTVTVGSGGAKEVKFTDPDGAASTVSLKGPGSVDINLDGTGLSSSTSKSGILTVIGTPTSVSLDATATTAASTLTITGKGGDGAVNLAGISSDGSFKAITAATTALAGSSAIAGSVVKLSLGSATGSISAGAIGKLAVKGSLAASLSASSVGSTTAGSLAGSWAVTGSAGSISTPSVSGFTATVGALPKLIVKGSLSNSVIRSSGAITTVQAGGLADCDFYAGISSAVAAGALPTSADLSASAAISSVKIGKSGYVGSVLAAADLGKLSLGFVTLDNSGTPFGLAAQQISALTAKVNLTTKLNLKNVTSQSQVTAALASAGITPVDFDVEII